MTDLIISSLKKSCDKKRIWHFTYILNFSELSTFAMKRIISNPATGKARLKIYKDDLAGDGQV
jgi:hypothetical protein